MQRPALPFSFSRIPAGVWIMGLVTLLINLSSIMIFSLSPLYITQVFGLAAFQLGLLEGGVEFFSWITRIFSGVISDHLSKRKPLLLCAYMLTFCSRPLFALAPTTLWVYIAKLADRISNGIQASPREALIGDMAPKEIKGTCYGLRQSLGLIGSLLGAGAVVYLMRITHNNYRQIFWIASIPPLLGLLALALFVKEVPPTTKDKKETQTSVWRAIENIKGLGRSFWTVSLVSGVFMLSNYSGAYRILQAERMGFPLNDISWTMVVQNLAALLAAFPIGRLADSFDRRILLSIGFTITITADICLGFVPGATGMLLGSALWGAQMGITQSIFLTLISETTTSRLRGTAFGVYYLVTAVALFSANFIMGYLFDLYGPAVAFSGSAVMAAIGLPLLSLLPTHSKKDQAAQITA